MILIHELAAGQRVRLNGDIIAEVRNNPRDGTWLIVRRISGPGISAPAACDEMALGEDVLELLD